MQKIYNEIGLFWRPLGGNNIDQISGHSYQYTDVIKQKDKFESTTIIVDLGKFDNHSALGVADSGAAVPDIRNLISNKKNSAKAILITHAHPDHLNGIVHYIKAGYKLPALYGGKYTKMILDDLYSEFGITTQHQPDFVEIKDEDEINLGSLNITVVASSHTCFNSFGFVIKSSNACVYHTGDMKIDTSTYFRKPTNLKKIKELAPLVDCVVADFCCIAESGMAVKEVETFKRIVKLIKQNYKKKIFIPVYPTHPEMYIIAFLAALKTKKHVVFYGNRDFYTYLQLMKEFRVDFSEIANDRISVLYHPENGLDGLDDNYVVIGTYNNLENYFDEDETNSFGIITAKTFFNPLKGQFNSRNIKFVTIEDYPELQGYGHGFFDDYEYINKILGAPIIIPTHCPAYVTDNLRNLASFVGMRLVETTPNNGWIYKISAEKCELIKKESANWLVVKYIEDSAYFVEVEQKPTSGEGMLKRTISNKRCKRKFDMILHQKQKGAK